MSSVLNIATKAERVALLNADRRVEQRATQNAISGALLIAAARLSDIRSHDPGGIDGLTEDDFGENAARESRGWALN